MLQKPRVIAPLLAVLALAAIGPAAASDPSQLGATTQREASWPRTVFVSTSKGSTLLAPLACVLKPKGKPRLGKVCRAAASPPTALLLSDLRVLKTRGWKSVRLSPWGEDDQKDLVLALVGGAAEEEAPVFGFGQSARPRFVEPFGAAPPPSSESAAALATLQSRRNLPTESLTLVARMDLNEDGQTEWLFYRKCVNEFRFELYDATFDLIAQYGHCGV